MSKLSRRDALKTITVGVLPAAVVAAADQPVKSPILPERQLPTPPPIAPDVEPPVPPEADEMPPPGARRKHFARGHLRLCGPPWSPLPRMTLRDITVYEDESVPNGVIIRVGEITGETDSVRALLETEFEQGDPWTRWANFYLDKRVFTVETFVLTSFASGMRRSIMSPPESDHLSPEELAEPAFTIDTLTGVYLRAVDRTGELLTERALVEVAPPDPSCQIKNCTATGDGVSGIFVGPLGTLYLEDCAISGFDPPVTRYLATLPFPAQYQRPSVGLAASSFLAQRDELLASPRAKDLFLWIKSPTDSTVILGIDRGFDNPLLLANESTVPFDRLTRRWDEPFFVSEAEIVNSTMLLSGDDWIFVVPRVGRNLLPIAVSTKAFKDPAIHTDKAGKLAPELLPELCEILTAAGVPSRPQRSHGPEVTISLTNVRLHLSAENQWVVVGDTQNGQTVGHYDLGTFSNYFFLSGQTRTNPALIGEFLLRLARDGIQATYRPWMRPEPESVSDRLEAMAQSLEEAFPRERPHPVKTVPTEFTAEQRQLIEAWERRFGSSGLIASKSPVPTAAEDEKKNFARITRSSIDSDGNESLDLEWPPLGPKKEWQRRYGDPKPYRLETTGYLQHASADSKEVKVGARSLSKTVSDDQLRIEVPGDIEFGPSPSGLKTKCSLTGGRLHIETRRDLKDKKTT